MVATLQYDIDCSAMQIKGQTEELVEWINKFRCKKVAIMRRKQKNYRVLSILSHVLAKAEEDLRIKQAQRYKRWQLLKMKLCKDSNIQKEEDHTQMQFDEKIKEDINSLNSFMAMLNQVKISSSR